MSRENQIDKQAVEEMAKDLYGMSIDTEEDCKYVAEVLYTAGYRKQGEDTLNYSKDTLEYEGEILTKAHIQAHYEAIYALAAMVNQFGYPVTFRNQKAVYGGGLSALEIAFGALQDCGCKLNSNGTITLKNLFVFQEEIDAKMKGGKG